MNTLAAFRVGDEHGAYVKENGAYDDAYGAYGVSSALDALDGATDFEMLQPAPNQPSSAAPPSNARRLLPTSEFLTAGVPPCPTPPLLPPPPPPSNPPQPSPNDVPRATPPPNAPRKPPDSAKAWQKKRDKQRSKHKKAHLRDARTLGACPEKRAFLAHHLAVHEPHELEFSAADMGHDSTSYQGPKGGGMAKRLWTVEECVERWGHVVKKWDGKTPIPILDRLGRIFGICAGTPEDEDWDTVHQDAAAHIQTARGECNFPKLRGVPLRGRFATMAAGVSFGGGQVRPGNLVHSVANARSLSKLLETRTIRRLMAFASGKPSIRANKSRTKKRLQAPSSSGAHGYTGIMPTHSANSMPVTLAFSAITTAACSPARL